MATANVLEDHVTCSICFEVYTDPQALPCLHPYCHKCIRQLAAQNDGQVECPNCRKISSVWQIQKDFRTQGLVNTYLAETTARPVLYATLRVGRYSQEQCNEIHYEYYIEQMLWVGGKIWCSIYDGIYIYNKDCEKIGEIKQKFINYSRGLVQTSTGHVVVACSDDCGLHQLDGNGVYLNQILPGSYADVSFYDNRLYVLDYANAKVLIMEPATIGVVNSWKQIHEFSIGYNGGRGEDRICVHRGGILVSSWSNNKLYSYNFEGQFIKHVGETGTGGSGKLLGPLLCGVDNTGSSLIVDSGNHQLQVHGGDGQWRIIPLPGDMCNPICVLVDSGSQDIYVATYGKQLIRYVKQ